VLGVVLRRRSRFRVAADVVRKVPDALVVGIHFRGIAVDLQRPPFRYLPARVRICHLLFDLEDEDRKFSNHSIFDFE
jgi:hypothetical protein